jgi:pimeloyl-ACP methyl ester carboxylesterase
MVMIKVFYWLLVIFGVLYLVICLFFYLYQEKLIFYPAKLPRNYQFRFRQAFREYFIPADDGKQLHGILFKADSSKGLVFFLHGNAGALNSWGEIATTYTDLQYDVFMLDYRGFGKSEGGIQNEDQFYSDVQHAYDYISPGYNEQDIVIIGFSIGSAAAARLASVNQPGRLILQAPYYSLTDLMQNISPAIYAILPPFVFKYAFKSYEFLEKTQAPVSIFHGNRDEVIYVGSAEKLKKHLKPIDQVVIIPGLGHNGFHENADYTNAIRRLLRPMSGSSGTYSY